MSKWSMISIAVKVILTGGKYLVTLFCDAVNWALNRTSYEKCEKVGPFVSKIGDCFSSIAGLCETRWGKFFNAVAKAVIDIGNAIADSKVEVVEAEMVWEDVKDIWVCFLIAKRHSGEDEAEAK